MKLTGSERIYQTFSIVIVSLLSIISFYPVLYIIGLSLTGEQEWLLRKGFIFWPTSPTLIGYNTLLVRQGSYVLRAFTVSVLRTIIGTMLTLTMTVVTGYVLSRRNIPGKRIMLFGLLFTILFGGGLIPTYLVVRDTGLLNKLWALVIPGLVYNWGVLVFRQFFENIPQEIEESALVDGAGEFALMTKIILPMSTAAMAAIGLFIAVGHWNSWFDAMIYIKNRNLYPIQLLLRNLLLATTQIELVLGVSQVVDAGVRSPTISLKMAVAVIGTLPILCVYPFLQKYFIKGVYMGSVKG
jgi:putative aldouronate transport system permease protein